MNSNNSLHGFQSISFSHQWWARLLLLIGMGGYLALNYLLEKQPNSHFWPIILLISLYSIQTLSALFKSHDRHWIVRLITPMDSLIAGFLTVYPTASLAALIAFTSIAIINTINDRRGIHWPYSVAAFVLGLTLAHTLTETPWIWSTSASSIILLPFIIALIYLLLALDNTHHELEKNDALIRQFNKSHVDLKLRQYQLSKYLSPALREKLSSHKEVSVKTSRKKLTLFFSDIVGFTQFAEDMEGSQLTEFLNTYLTEMASIANEFGGTVDKFMGDGIMIFFGDPHSRGFREDAVACVLMALKMRHRMDILQNTWSNCGITEPLKVRIGINTGFCAVGNFGTNDRLDYTALGTEVNIASRLETSAEPNEILISETTYQLIHDKILCEPLGERPLKGINRRVQLYRVLESREALGPDSAFIEETGTGFSLSIDLSKINTEDKPLVISRFERALNRLKKTSLHNLK